MSLIKQVKGVLKSKNVESIVVLYEDGESEEHALESKGGKDAVKKLINSIEWERVAEVQFVLSDDDEEDDNDD